jgi:hypothetical protein
LNNSKHREDRWTREEGLDDGTRREMFEKSAVLVYKVR